MNVKMPTNKVQLPLPYHRDVPANRLFDNIRPSLADQLVDHMLVLLHSNYIHNMEDRYNQVEYEDLVAVY